jgi:hypothetical protein
LSVRGLISGGEYGHKYHLLAFAVFLLLDDLLELLLPFGLLVVLHGVLDSSFKLYAFCCQWTHQGGD